MQQTAFWAQEESVLERALFGRLAGLRRGGGGRVVVDDVGCQIIDLAGLGCEVAEVDLLDGFSPLLALDQGIHLGGAVD